MTCSINCRYDIPVRSIGIAKMTVNPGVACYTLGLVGRPFHESHDVCVKALRPGFGCLVGPGYNAPSIFAVTPNNPITFVPCALVGS
jgi:hypothetical protein